MVSLGNDSTNARHSGGYFFNDDSVQNSDDDLLVDHLTLTNDTDPPFRKINIIWSIIAVKILFIVLILASFLVPVLCDKGKCGTDPFSIVVYTHGGMWCVLLVFDRYFRHKHHVSRLQGYLEFYRKTRYIRRWPFTLNSGANALAVVVVRVVDKYCSKEKPCTVLDRDNYIQIVIAVEVILVLPVLILYLVRTVKFNRQKAYPDVSQDEMLTSFIQSQSMASDVGFKDENFVDQVLEKQADMIRYLKQHNTQLGKRILTLTSEVNAYKSQSRASHSIGSIN
ncbi:transmembrane protein 192 [Patella vulgata]|uniref:transmembrane protein 192 n=1 Tax=Patella vulgata TaxID=6465 RepID=UPI0024A8595B|nr:transmembrane protein 192 [Patella vulgata]